MHPSGAYTSWDRARLERRGPDRRHRRRGDRLHRRRRDFLRPARRRSRRAAREAVVLARARRATASGCCARSRASPPPSARSRTSASNGMPIGWRPRVGHWLKTYLRSRSRLRLRRRRQAALFAVRSPPRSVLDRNARRPDMKAVLDYMRGRNPDLHGAIRLTEANTPRRRPARASRGDPQPRGPARGHRRGRGRTGRRLADAARADRRFR